MSAQWGQGRRNSFKQKGRGQRSARMDASGISGPDERKFERRTSDINKRLKELENKLKPIPSNAIQLIHAEIAKETAELAEIEKAKEANAVETRSIDGKIREIGVQYKEKRMISNDLLAGVRHKTGSRHDDAVERLEQQILIRRCSSAEEMKFKKEIDALKKSKERLVEYNAAKSLVDTLKKEQEDLRAQRDSLYRQNKELRSKELSQKDKLSSLKAELEEAKDRKKVSNIEREEIRKEMDALYRERKDLIDKFRSEQLAFSQQLNQQKEEERLRRDEIRALRERKRQFRVIEQTFQNEERITFQHKERITTCNALIVHLQRLSLSATGAGASDQTLGLAVDGTDLLSAPPPATSSTSDTVVSTAAAVNPDPSASASTVLLPPQRSASDPPSKGQEGEFILRREKDEVLVPTTVSLKRKRSKKDKKRNIPMVVKRLNLNPTLFEQFGNLGIKPPSTLSDIPRVISLLQDKLADLGGMTKNQVPTTMDYLVDSGLGSKAPSEMLDPVDRVDDFSASQEAEEMATMNLDPGLGSAVVSPKRSHSDTVATPNGDVPFSKLLPTIPPPPQRSATTDNRVIMMTTAATATTTTPITTGGGSGGDDELSSAVSSNVASTHSNGAAATGTSISVGGNVDE